MLRAIGIWVFFSSLLGLGLFFEHVRSSKRFIVDNIFPTSLRQDLSLHLIIRKALHRFRGKDYDRLLELLNQETIRLLGVYNRFQAAGMLCRFCSLTALDRFRRLNVVPDVSRAMGSINYPARFMLVAAMNSCVCGFFTDPQKECICTPPQIQLYRSKVSGALLDRIDVQIEVPGLRC